MQRKTFLKKSIKNDKLIRWIDRSMPLKVYIAPFRWYKAKNEDSRYREMVMQALRTWEQATQGKVKFHIVNTLFESQINIDWKRIDRKALGYCTFNTTDDCLLAGADVQIGLSDGVICSRYQDENEVFHTILHELGHAIGLGHSDNKSDLMYSPHQYGITNLSQADKDTAWWLYSLPAGISIHEIMKEYSSKTSDIDEIIYSIVNKKTSQKNIKEERKDLLKEQDEIARIKKYNIQIQNIQISQEVHAYLKTTQHKKNKT